VEAFPCARGKLTRRAPDIYKAGGIVRAATVIGGPTNWPRAFTFGNDHLRLGLRTRRQARRELSRVLECASWRYFGQVPKSSQWRSMSASRSNWESRVPSSVVWVFHIRSTALGPANLKWFTASACRRKWASNAAQWMASDVPMASPFVVLIFEETERQFGTKLRPSRERESPGSRQRGSRSAIESANVQLIIRVMVAAISISDVDHHNSE
jgi:hypothetical protein